MKKWSPILHTVAYLTGIVGALALVAAWIAAYSASGSFWGMSEQHLFNDAQGLLLVSIAFGIGTLIHQNEER
jgi:hypothetical protein